MVRVLYVNGNIMKRGGIEAFMMNYYRHIDKTKVQIDFLVHGYEKGVYDDEILSSGGRIFHVPTKSKHPIKYKKELKKLFHSEKYDIIHSHLDAMSGWILKIAKDCGIPVRIAHSHNTDHLTTNPIKRIINDYMKKRIPYYATDLFACSQEAGEWLFGNSHAFKIINNAIEIDNFLFSKEKRACIRKNLGLENKFVIGHVGRFDYQKNQEFIISMLPDLVKKRNNIHAVFVGDGHQIEDATKLSGSLGVKNLCTFLGSRADVADLYNAFDVFVLPSRFEGLGIVAIEAQANGLPCILSNKIPTTVKLCDNVTMLSIESNLQWIRLLESMGTNRSFENELKIIEAGYEIKKEAAMLQDFYLRRGNC